MKGRVRRREKSFADKRRRKAASYAAAGKNNSMYSRKRGMLKKMGVFGFEVPEPKPWK